MTSVLAKTLGVQTAQHHYFAASHGRGLWDTEGGNAHREIRELINCMGADGALPTRNAKEIRDHLQAARTVPRYHHAGAGTNAVDRRFYHYLKSAEIAKVRRSFPETKDLWPLPKTRKGVYSTCGLGAEFQLGWRVLPCYSCKACDDHPTNPSWSMASTYEMNPDHCALDIFFHRQITIR